MTDARKFGAEQAELMKRMNLPAREHVKNLLGIIFMLGDEMGMTPLETLNFIELETEGVVRDLGERLRHK